MTESAILATILMSMKSGLPEEEEECLLVMTPASGSIISTSFSDSDSGWSLDDIISAHCCIYPLQKVYN